MRQVFRAAISAAALAASVTAFSGAHATTYIGSRTVGTGSVNLSITTDGTIGVIDDVNVLDYTIDLINLDGTFTLTGANSATLIFGSALTATASDLLFDFGQNGGALFQAPFTGSGGTFYCLQGGSASCFDLLGAGEGVEATTDFVFPRTPQSGIQVIASVAGPGAIPEPATWALMVLGFGLVGGAMRSARRRQRVTVSYA